MHYPYLIGDGEYPYLNYLFLQEDHDSFMKEEILNTKAEIHQKRCGNNYDEMLWGHINWDKMFQDVITELSKLDISEKLGKMFEETLVDYVPYAAIRYDELPKEYARVYIFPDDRERKRQDAVKWVHLRRGSELFKQTFYKKFKGKKLRYFDNRFSEFVSDYLKIRNANEYSFGRWAYDILKNICGVETYWKSLDEVKYKDMSDKKSDLANLLEDYIENGREQVQKLKKYQQDFDALQIDIKSYVDKGNFQAMAFNSRTSQPH